VAERVSTSVVAGEENKGTEDEKEAYGAEDRGEDDYQGAVGEGVMGWAWGW